MQRRPVVLAVYDSRWFMRTIEIAKRRGIRYQLYYSKESVPFGSVVYTDLEQVSKELQDREDVEVILDPTRTCRHLERAFMASMYIDSYDYIVIGIDTGKLLSYVVLGNDKLLLYGEGDYKQLENDLNYVFNCISFKKALFRIGTGLRSPDLVKMIRSRYDSDIELVDESATTPGNRVDNEIYVSMKQRGLKPHREKDIYAAYRIALSKGVKIV